METIAENTTIVNKKLFSEAMATADNYRGYARKGMGILGAAWLLFLIGSMIFKVPMVMAVGELLVISAVGVWLLVLYPRGRYKKAYKAMLRRNDGITTREILFYEDHLVSRIGDNETYIGYEEIATMRQSKHLLVMTTTDKIGIFLDLDGFTKGSLEDIMRKMNNMQEEEA